MYYTYILLESALGFSDSARKLPAVRNTHRTEQFDDEWALQPLTSIHLYSHLTNELEANGYIGYIYILGVRP